MHTLIDLLRHASEAQSVSHEGDDRPSRFWAHGCLPAALLSVEVEGFGLLGQPLSAAQAQALQDLSQPARFGLREQTLLDPAVRHTGEVSADLIGLDWQPGAFAALKRDVARALGVARLDAWLHNLLIYGPGQFFKPHQDTEKHPGMVGTLVVVWPSPHIGGTLRVQLGQQQEELASQHLHSTDLRWFAFYADCRHEVLPVLEGWRVALTFDLVLPAQVERPEVPTSLQKALQAALHRQFALDSDSASLDPWVLLLDHEYTEHGLRWPLLKGDDRWRAAALRAAGEALGLSLHLALAELHQSWTAQVSPRSRWDRSGDDSPEPDELIDESLTLDFWVDAQDNVGPRSSLAVRLDHTVCLTETGPDHLVNEEYEGYMGNYGETLDYWYRRAALVVQSPLGAERDRFQLDFDAALADALRLAQDPAAAPTLLSRVHVAAGLLADAAVARGRSVLQAYAEIAAALPDADTALALMRSFDPATLLPEDAPVLAVLERLRGTPWTQALLQAWHDPQARRSTHAAAEWRPGWGTLLTAPALWPTPLPAFTQAAQAGGWSRMLLDDWFGACGATLFRFDQTREQARPANRMLLLPTLLHAVGELAQALVLRGEAGEGDLKALIDEVLVRPVLYPPEQLAPFVQSAGPLSDHWPPARSLRTHVVAALRTALSEPERTPSDHRLHRIEWTCRCQDCTGLIAWAESPSAEPLVMAMAEQRRQHVQQQLQAAGALLSATTLKQGSPHKLVLRKPDDLLARDRAVRLGWARDLSATER